MILSKTLASKIRNPVRIDQRENTTCATMQKFLNLFRGIASILCSISGEIRSKLTRGLFEKERRGVESEYCDNGARPNEEYDERPRGKGSLRTEKHSRIWRWTGKGILIR